MMISAGRLSHRIRVERRAAADDGYGNAEGAWGAVSGLESISAAFRPQFGREQVEAGRMEATMRGTLTLRRAAATLGILASDRVVFLNAPYAGTVAAIRSLPIPTPDGVGVELAVEAGVAT